MKMKYVVTDRDDFAIFTQLSEHSKIAQALYGKPVGAGFCTVRQEADSADVNVHCWGESVTLNLKSREEDEEIINKRLNNDWLD